MGPFINIHVNKGHALKKIVREVVQKQDKYGCTEQGAGMPPIASESRDFQNLVEYLQISAQHINALRMLANIHPIRARALNRPRKNCCCRVQFTQHRETISRRPSAIDNHRKFHRATSPIAWIQRSIDQLPWRLGQAVRLACNRLRTIWRRRSAATRSDKTPV